MAGKGYPMGHVNGWEWIPSSGGDGPRKRLGGDFQLCT